MSPTTLAAELWQRLWLDYREQVCYARAYQEMMESSGGTFANDHIAFRSLRLTVDTPEGKINLGIAYLDEIVTRLGYRPVNVYEFPEQHLFAQHYAVPDDSTLPKLFISELKVDELPAAVVSAIRQTVGWQSGYDLSLWSRLSIFEKLESQEIVSLMQPRFQRIWGPPYLSTLEAVNQVSQYGAWVLLHGYRVNHFTAYVNRQNSMAYPNLDLTIQGLKQLGVPMKSTIEGSDETGLRQTATQPVLESVTVIDDAMDCPMQIQWPYAYFELAQRYPLGADSTEVFEGFLSPQAAHLFAMTRHVSPSK